MRRKSGEIYDILPFDYRESAVTTAYVNGVRLFYCPDCLMPLPENVFYKHYKNPQSGCDPKFVKWVSENCDWQCVIDAMQRQGIATVPELENLLTLWGLGQ